MELLFIYVALQIADATTTVIGMRLGARELNKYVRKIQDFFGRLWPLAKVGLGLMLLYVLWDNLLIANLAMAAVVINNLIVIRSLR